LTTHRSANDADSPHADCMTPGEIGSVLRLIGLTLSDERVSAMAPQMESQLEVLRMVDRLDAEGAEPAMELRLR
jgi:hypothetical protein